MTMMNRSTMAQPQQSAAAVASDDCCVHCGHAGSDVRIKSCPNGCSYHARCLDLVSISQRREIPSSVSSSSVADDVACSLVCCTICPCCSSPASGLEIIPLSFSEMDAAQRLSGYRNKSSPSNGSVFTAPSGKRMHGELTSTGFSDPRTSSEASFYDPASPRTGKWSDEEIAFRDEMVPHFVDGSLPLPNGLKLIDFLSSALKSKPSRLTKKMKHAKLSTRHFHLNTGHIRSSERAKELSRLELSFVNSISDAVERSEIKFHMRREWRDHVAERLTFLRIQFDATEWLKSVDVMDRRTTSAKSRNRMVKRRFMMGKAMEKDTSSPTPGVFIEQGSGVQDDDVDLELLASALEANDAEDDDLRGLYYVDMAFAEPDAIQTGSAVHAQEVSSADDGGINSYRRSITADSGRSNVVTKASFVSNVSSRPSSADSNHVSSPAPFRSALLPSLGSAEGPNFRFAAPFLAKITAYIERERMPFEHVDIWVPSSLSDPVMLDPTGATAPELSLLGSGSSTSTQKKDGDKGKLCFAGSASMGVQIVEDSYNGVDLPAPPLLDYRSKPGCKAVPLSSDEIYHLSLFGSYSEKFSFSSGCGLPGRVFESAVPAWEQFIANAPSHLFERRGGAMQFGIQTALGLPIRSPSVGRIVLVLYSRHNREKDDGLVARMVRDFQSFNPCPRWKLMVDMGSTASPSNSNASNNPMMDGQQQHSQQGGAIERANRPEGLTTATAALSANNAQILSLISLLGEHMPSDQTTPLGQQLHNIMSLRLVLLRTNRAPQDEQLVESIVTLFQSYVQAGRSRPDITLMLARDFAFHSKMQQQQQQQYQLAPHNNMAQHQGLNFGRQMSIPPMQHLSLGAMASQPHQRQEVSCQLDHTHHGLPRRDDVSAATAAVGPNPGQQNTINQCHSSSVASFSSAATAAGPKAVTESRCGPNTIINQCHSSSVASFSSMTERDYSSPKFQVSPKSSASLNRLESAQQPIHLDEPPLSLPL
mmetsp:Transcript_23287/g.44133  ORF Transcript_23287/g.44133 Transcript_23287/m.44133 type:complete len:989 (+) Transcript_23287:292-3258(+)